jgi:TPR repeat protein
MNPWRFALSMALALLLWGPRPAVAGFDEGVTALQAGQYAVALDIWQKSAEAGDAKSQYGLGYLYQFGLGTDPDNTQAKAWYEKAAAQNEPDALFALGLMYESGLAGATDRAKAIELYRKAVATGRSPDAEYALGRVYMRGQGVPRDEKQGLVWLIKAAEMGQPAAEYMIGAAYETGGVLKADKVEAYYWYSGALLGDQAVLRETDPEFDAKAALDTLVQHMTRNEIADAKAKLKKTPPPQAEPSPGPAGTKG